MTTLSLGIRPARLISPRSVPLLQALLMSLLVTALVSALLTLVNTGVDAGYPARWLRNLGVGWLAAFPLVYLVGPRLLRSLLRAATVAR